MGFDWSAYIVIAEDIFTKANNGEYLEKKEAWLRAAISRAYYGVHMLVKTQSLKTGYTRQDELNNNQNSIHSFMIQRTKHPIKGILSELRRYRTHADYKDEFPAIEKGYKRVQSLLQYFKKEFPNVSFETYS
ncbi:MAG: hypothetical protein ACOYK1_06125 [Vampirovibrionia bacterium]